MRHAVVVSSVACFAAFLLAACERPTPLKDTEGETLTYAVQGLADAGVWADNVTVAAADGSGPAVNLAELGTNMGDPDNLYVCAQKPDEAVPNQPVTLEVAAGCAEKDSPEKKRTKAGQRG